MLGNSAGGKEKTKNTNEDFLVSPRKNFSGTFSNILGKRRRSRFCILKKYGVSAWLRIIIVLYLYI
jgi:hypothetical protein